MTVERFPIEAGHIMMFARAIGDDNPVYYDREQAARSEVGGIIAPPTFVQASAQYDPDYPLRPRTGVTWHGSSRNPSGRESTSDAPSAGGGTRLHAEQHYEYHHPLRPGDVLIPHVREGETWEKQGRRGGLLRFFETITEYRSEDGELVVSARSIGVRTDQTVGA